MSANDKIYGFNELSAAVRYQLIESKRDELEFEFCKAWEDAGKDSEELQEHLYRSTKIWFEFFTDYETGKTKVDTAGGPVPFSDLGYAYGFDLAKIIARYPELPADKVKEITEDGGFYFWIPESIVQDDGVDVPAIEFVLGHDVLDEEFTKEVQAHPEKYPDQELPVTIWEHEEIDLSTESELVQKVYAEIAQELTKFRTEVENQFTAVYRQAAEVSNSDYIVKNYLVDHHYKEDGTMVFSNKAIENVQD